jgi:hypothetical protein
MNHLVSPTQQEEQINGQNNIESFHLPSAEPVSQQLPLAFFMLIKEEPGSSRFQKMAQTFSLRI